MWPTSACRSMTLAAFALLGTRVVCLGTKQIGICHVGKKNLTQVRVVHRRVRGEDVADFSGTLLVKRDGEFEGKKVPDANSLIVAIRARSVGDTVGMKVQRGNQTVDVRMTLQSASG